MSKPSMPHPSDESGDQRWMETLRNGRSVLIRPIHKRDKDAEHAFIEGLNPETRRYRFLGALGEPSEQMLRGFTDIDQVQHVGLAAVVEEEADELIIGVSRYYVGKDTNDCEFAVTVEEDWQGQGLGTALMTRLIDIARTRGIHRMYSIDSAANTRMNDLAGYLGFQTRSDPDDAAQVIHELEL